MSPSSDYDEPEQMYDEPSVVNDEFIEVEYHDVSMEVHTNDGDMPKEDAEYSMITEPEEELVALEPIEESEKASDEATAVEPSVTTSNNEMPAFAPNPSTESAGSMPVVVDRNIDTDPTELDLNTGSMVYDCPTEMVVGDAHIVKLRISRKKNNNISVGFSNDTTIYEIETSEVMEVILSDPNPDGVNKQFDIKPLTDGVQALENDERYNEWTWGVTPIRSGGGKLKLVINIKKKTDFGNMNRSITVFEKDINITADHIYSIRRFFYNNWEWFASSVAIPLVVFGWKRREKLLGFLRKKTK